MTREPHRAVDPLARRLSALALAVSFLALVFAGFSAWRTEAELRALRVAVERALQVQRTPSLGPGPMLDTED